VGSVKGPSGACLPPDSGTLRRRKVAAPSTRAAPNLRRLRTDRALTQQQLAELAGVPRSTIALLEAGKEARMPTLAKLAHALGVEPHELMQPSPPAS
jgi:DNA-binding XRE family transcriptional regulator